MSPVQRKSHYRPWYGRIAARRRELPVDLRRDRPKRVLWRGSAASGKVLLPAVAKLIVDITEADRRLLSWTDAG